MPLPAPAQLQPLVNHIAAWQPALLATSTGFQRRLPKKITPAGFLLTACLFALQSSASLTAFAQLWALLHQQTLSKQAVHKRCSAAAVAFLQAVLQALLCSLIPRPPELVSRPPRFRRILVQDSTTLALPAKLAPLFPGPANQSQRAQAALKIQATLDLLQNQWVQFRLTPFTCNDPAAAPQILPELQKQDLVVRDLGYWSLPVLRQIHQAGAFFLSRWRYGSRVTLPGTSAPADLVRLFGQSAVWDATVLLGQESLPVRLIAVRLPPALAAERRRKALANRDRRLHHSPQYLQLLDWNIFITNAPPLLASATLLTELYTLRWRIETIFKAWKSHFNLRNLTNGSAEQVLIVILGKLIWISWFTGHGNHLARCQTSTSLLKLARWWAQFAPLVFQPRPLCPETVTTLIRYYCRYEKRRSRLNFHEKCSALS